MKTFLSALLLVLLAVVALKLLPLVFGLACALGALATLVLLAGASAAAVVIAVALVGAAVLSPLWIPVLAVVGIVALVRHRRRAVV